MIKKVFKQQNKIIYFSLFISMFQSRNPINVYQLLLIALFKSFTHSFISTGCLCSGIISIPSLILLTFASICPSTEWNSFGTFFEFSNKSADSAWSRYSEYSLYLFNFLKAFLACYLYRSSEFFVSLSTSLISFYLLVDKCSISNSKCLVAKGGEFGFFLRFS